jgi:hypothetical protein
VRGWTHRVVALVAVTVLTPAAAQGVAGASMPGAGFAATPLSAGPVTSLPAAPVAVVPGEPTSAGEATAWVLGGHAVWKVTIARNGTGTVSSTTTLPPGADAVALTCGSLRPELAYEDFSDGFVPCGGSALMFVLDRASEAVLVFKPMPDGSLALAASLAVGSRPSALVRANFNADEDELIDLAVSNEGSDDVSVLLAREDGSYAPQRRFAVGSRPRDLVPGWFDGRLGIDLVVADSGTTSLSLLRGNGEGSFDRSELPLGATPTSFLAASPARLPDLNDDGPGDLVVADAAGGTISVLLVGSGGLPPRLASRVSLPGGAPVALRVTDGLVDERPHLLVAARGTGEVLDIPIGESGALGVPSSVLSGVRPVALDARSSVTADLATDVLVADDSGALRLLVASPSRTVHRRSGAANVAARDGLVVWSQRVGSRRYRLRLADGSGVRYLPASTSRRQLAPRVGRAADGTPVVTYRRCRVMGCTPWVWSVAGNRARRVRAPTARGCSATDFALWDGALAFMSASSATGSCRRRDRGLWVSTRARRVRISGRANRLGDLRGRRVTWFDGDDTFGYLRVSSLHGRPRTVTRWTADDGGAFGLGLLSGRHVYWLATRFRTTGSMLRRAPVSARASSCQTLAADGTIADPGRDFGWRPLAVDGAELSYVDARGVFATTPEETRWRACG